MFGLCKLSSFSIIEYKKSFINFSYWIKDSMILTEGNPCTELNFLFPISSDKILSIREINLEDFFVISCESEKRSKINWKLEQLFNEGYICCI